MLANGEASSIEVAAELGTGTSTVKRWRDQYFKYGEDYFLKSIEEVKVAICMLLFTLAKV